MLGSGSIMNISYLELSIFDHLYGLIVQCYIRLYYIIHVL